MGYAEPRLWRLRFAFGANYRFVRARCAPQFVPVERHSKPLGIRPKVTYGLGPRKRRLSELERPILV